MQQCNCKAATSVKGAQYTGRYGYMQIADNLVRRVRMATVNLDTPYYVGTP